MARSLGDFVAVSTANDGERVALKDLDVSAGVVMVAGLTISISTF